MEEIWFYLAFPHLPIPMFYSVTVVFSSTFVHCYLYCLGYLLLHHFHLYSFSTSWLLRLCLPHFHYIGTVIGAPLFYVWVVAWFLPFIQTPVPVVLPPRLASWALQCCYALGRQCQFLMSLLSHFRRSICSPCLWASPSTLPGLLGCLAGYVGHDVLSSSDCGILLSLVLLPSTTLSQLFHVPCPSGSGVRLPYRLPCLRHREFLPASVRGLSAADNLFTCGACGFSLSGVGCYHFLQAPQSSFSLRSPQYLVAVASRSSSTSSSFLGRLGSLPRSPLRIAVHHPLLPRASEQVRFHSPAPSSTLLSPRPSPGGIRGRLPRLALLSLVSSWIFPIPGPSRDAVTCAWCLYSCYFSCYPLLPDCTYCAWRV